MSRSQTVGGLLESCTQKDTGATQDLRTVAVAAGPTVHGERRDEYDDYDNEYYDEDDDDDYYYYEDGDESYDFFDLFLDLW